MRLSSLVIAMVLFLSVPLLAQHSSGGGGGGGASSGGHSGGGSSGGGSAGGSSHGGAGSSHGSSGASSSSSGGRSNSSNARSERVPSERPSSERASSERTFAERSSSERVSSDPALKGWNIHPNLLKPPVSEKVEAKPEKKGVFSFLHHKKPAPEPVISPDRRFCKKGQNCVIPARPACQTYGRFRTSSFCSSPYDQYPLFNGCQALADQLAAERDRMRNTNDPGESLRYQMLLDQYQQCMRRYGTQPFSSYFFNDLNLLTP